MDLLGNNPGPTNVAAGLSTIEEKSLGGIAKGGAAPIRGLVDIAEAPPGPGLYVMDAPAYAPESVTGFVAAGTQIVLFTTGVGNSFVSGLAPTIKISGNPEAARRLTSSSTSMRARFSPGARRSTPQRPACTSWCSRSRPEPRPGARIPDEGEDVVSRLGPAL